MTNDIDKEMKDAKELFYVVTFAIVCFIGLYLYFTVHKPMTASDYQQQLDSLQKHNVQREHVLDSLQKNATMDSVRIQVLSSHLRNPQDIINKVNQRYEKAQDSINHLSTDKQLQFFSNWLSKDSSHSKR